MKFAWSARAVIRFSCLNSRLKLAEEYMFLISGEIKF